MPTIDLSNEEIVSRLEESQEFFRKMGLADLKLMEQVLLARNKQLKWKADRVREVYGEEHQELALLQGRLDFDVAFFTALKKQIKVDEKAPVPGGGEGPDKNVWQVNGLVKNADGSPAAGVAVGLYDVKNKKSLSFGADTNADGYYQIRLTKNELRELNRITSLTVAVFVNDTVTPSETTLRPKVGESDGVDINLRG